MPKYSTEGILAAAQRGSLLSQIKLEPGSRKSLGTQPSGRNAVGLNAERTPLGESNLNRLRAPVLDIPSSAPARLLVEQQPDVEHRSPEDEQAAPEEHPSAEDEMQIDSQPQFEVRLQCDIMFPSIFYSWL